MILTVDKVTKRFGGLTAVNRVSVEIEEGAIFGLIGPNGAGKTTLLNVIAGVYRPDGGSIHFEGKKISGSTPERICRLGIARTFQISQLFPKLTARETVLMAASYGARLSGHKADAQVESVMDYVGFDAPPETPCEKLTTGQRKRLDLARALASNPRLLLMDEAGAGLTPAELDQLTRLMQKMCEQGITIIVIEHLMRMIMGSCHKILVLHYGEAIAIGAPSELVQNQKVVDAYLGDRYEL